VGLQPRIVIIPPAMTIPISATKCRYIAILSPNIDSFGPRNGTAAYWGGCGQELTALNGTFRRFRNSPIQIGDLCGAAWACAALLRQSTRGAGILYSCGIRAKHAVVYHN